MENKVKDPVCGREFFLHSAHCSYRYLGHIYYFCSRRCLITFDQDPEKYCRWSANRVSN
ncbi:MAG: YHS domain-containing protein [Anaerolineaceae bacterium]|nr:YHS domain-containing protein [Anaerolineaceae bacterium]